MVSVFAFCFPDFDTHFCFSLISENWDHLLCLGSRGILVLVPDLCALCARFYLVPVLGAGACVLMMRWDHIWRAFLMSVGDGLSVMEWGCESWRVPDSDAPCRADRMRARRGVIWVLGLPSKRGDAYVVRLYLKSILQIWSPPRWYNKLGQKKI